MFEIGDKARVKVLDEYHLSCCEGYAGMEGVVIGFNNNYNAKYAGVPCPMVDIEGKISIYFHPDDLELISKAEKQTCSTCGDQECGARGATDEMESECGEHKPVQSKPKFCPMRKQKTAVYGHLEGTVSIWEEEFLPCIGDKCGWWGNGECVLNTIGSTLFNSLKKMAEYGIHVIE